MTASTLPSASKWTMPESERSKIEQFAARTREIREAELDALRASNRLLKAKIREKMFLKGHANE